MLTLPSQTTNADAGDLPRSPARALIGTACLAYLTAVAVFAWTVSQALFERITSYVPQLDWAITEIGGERMAALRSAGLVELANSYALFGQASLLLIGVSLAIGAATPFLHTPRLLASDPVATMQTTVGAVFFGAVFLMGPAFTDKLFQAGALPVSMSHFPGLWIATMTIASLFAARAAGFLVHDLIVAVIGRGEEPAHDMRRR